MLGAGTREGVDGLRDVAHHADVVPFPEPQVEQPLLEGGHVLVLVDDEVAVLAAHLVGDVVPFGEDPHHEQEHVLEVDDGSLRLDLLVGAQQGRDGREVEPARLLPARGGRTALVVLRRHHGDLGPLDLTGEVPDRDLVDAEPEPPAASATSGALCSWMRGTPPPPIA